MKYCYIKAAIIKVVGKNHVLDKKIDSGQEL